MLYIAVWYLMNTNSCFTTTIRYTKMYIEQAKNTRKKEHKNINSFIKLTQVLVTVMTIVEMKAPATACSSAWIEADHFFLNTC